MTRSELRKLAGRFGFKGHDVTTTEQPLPTPHEEGSYQADEKALPGDSASIASTTPSEEAQGGVKQAEAINLVWTKQALLLAYGL